MAITDEVLDIGKWNSARR